MIFRTSDGLKPPNMKYHGDLTTRSNPKSDEQNWHQDP